VAIIEDVAESISNSKKGVRSKLTLRQRQEAEFPPYDWEALRPQPVIGIDEVGRGCLAGPVYAAAAIIPTEHAEFIRRLGVTDSKLLSSEKREQFALEIKSRCFVAVGIASAEEIDAINILQASFLAMRRALIDLEKVWQNHSLSGAGFGPSCAHFLVDGHMRIPMVGAEFASLSKATQTPLIKGDLRALPIAAASIVAKVARDQMMIEAAQEFPLYGFETHKGYAAPIHRKAIEEHGPTRLHRKTFGGVREFLHRATESV
jgi:ribonuclease HII